MRIETIESQIKCNATDEEIKANLAIYYEEQNYNQWVATQKEEYETLEIDLTFDEYLNETTVTTEAVYFTQEDWEEQNASDLTWEELGEENQQEWLSTIKTPEVTEQVRPYTTLTNEESLEKISAYLLTKVAERRKAKYASWEEQLGMLYQDMVNNTTTWIEHNQSVREQIPKEES